MKFIKTLKTILPAIVIIIFIAGILFALVTVMEDTQKQEENEKEQKVATTTSEVIYDRSAQFSIFNIGNSTQNSGNFCQTASQDNGCYLIEKGVGVCASNILKMHTIIDIEGLGECIILDRTSKEYSARIDFALPKDDVDKAMELGTPILKYRIIFEP